MYDRLPGAAWDNPIWHGKWRIFLNDQWTSHHDQWAYVHDDYDGDEDNRHGTAASPEDCIQEIEDNFGPQTPEEERAKIAEAIHTEWGVWLLAWATILGGFGLLVWIALDVYRAFTAR